MMTQEQVEQIAERIAQGQVVGYVNQWLNHDAEQRHIIATLTERVRELEQELEQIKTLLGCHRAYIQESIRDLQARTEDIPSIDRLRQVEAELARVKGAV